MLIDLPPTAFDFGLVPFEERRSTYGQHVRVTLFQRGSAAPRGGTLLAIRFPALGSSPACIVGVAADTFLGRC